MDGLDPASPLGKEKKIREGQGFGKFSRGMTLEADFLFLGFIFNPLVPIVTEN